MSRDAPHRRKCLYRVTEWLALRAQQMTVSPVIKADGVDVNLAALDVCQDEALWHASLDLRNPVVREHFPHAGLMGVPHDEVEVLVFARLLADQGVYTPAAVQPYIDCGLGATQGPRRHRKRSSCSATNVPADAHPTSLPPRAELLIDLGGEKAARGGLGGMLGDPTHATRPVG